MRYLLPVLTLACLAFAPRPKIGTLGASFAIAPDSTVNATATVSLTGTLQPGDSIRFKFMKDGIVQLNRSSVQTTMTANLPAPAYGATSSYTVSANMTRGGSNVGPVVTSRAWTYQRPAPPPPPPATIDSVVISPQQASGGPGSVKQFTAVAYQS